MKGPRLHLSGFSLAFVAIVAGLASGCTSSNSTSAASPGGITLSAATTRTTSIDIAWTNPPDEDFDHTDTTWSLNGVPVDTVSVGSGIATCSITGLTASTEYTIALTTVDASGNRSARPSLFSVFTTNSGEKVYSFIYTLDALNAVHSGLGGNYILMADLALNTSPYNTGAGWPPIGNDSAPFTGIFNGNDHHISNLFINNPSPLAFSGFFGRLNGAFVQNLHLSSVDVAGSSGLAEDALDSTVTHCSIDGAVAGSGGLIGYAGHSTISRCSAVVSVAGRTYRYRRACGVCGLRAAGGLLRHSLGAGRQPHRRSGRHCVPIYAQCVLRRRPCHRERVHRRVGWTNDPYGPDRLLCLGSRHREQRFCGRPGRPWRILDTDEMPCHRSGQRKPRLGRWTGGVS